MDKKFVVVGLILVLASAMVLAATANIPMPGGVTAVPTNQSIAYYVKMLNARMVDTVVVAPQVAPTNINVSASGNPILPAVTQTPVAPPANTTPSVPAGGIVSTTANVAVSEISVGSVKYYSAIFKKGFNKGADNFCVDASDKMIPGHNIQHGKYCFSISDYDVSVADFGIMNLDVEGTRVPINNSDSRTKLDCDWRSASTSAMLQVGKETFGYNFDCGIQENNYWGSNEIEDAVRLSFSDKGVIQYSNGDLGFEVRVGVVTGTETYQYYPN